MHAKISVGIDVNSPAGSGRRRVRAISAVDLLLDEAVDRRGGAGDERNAERPEHDRTRGRNARHREEHADDGDEDDERHHSRLGQREKVPQADFGEREGGHGIFAQADIGGFAALRRAGAGDFITAVAASSPDSRGAQQALEVAGEPLDIGILGIAEHEIAERVDDEDARGPARQRRQRRRRDPSHDEPGMRRQERLPRWRAVGHEKSMRTTRSCSPPCIVRACRVA